MIRLGRLRPIGNRALIGCSGGCRRLNRQATLKAILCLTVLVFLVLRPFWGPTGSFEGISLPVGPGWGNSKTVQPQPQTERDTLERMSP